MNRFIKIQIVILSGSLFSMLFAIGSFAQSGDTVINGVKMLTNWHICDNQEQKYLATLNGYYQGNISLVDLSGLSRIIVYPRDNDLRVTSFRISCSGNRITVFGDSLTPGVRKMLERNPNTGLLVIDEIKAITKDDKLFFLNHIILRVGSISDKVEIEQEAINYRLSFNNIISGQMSEKEFNEVRQLSLCPDSSGWQVKSFYLSGMTKNNIFFEQEVSGDQLDEIVYLLIRIRKNNEPIYIEKTEIIDTSGMIVRIPGMVLKIR